MVKIGLTLGYLKVIVLYVQAHKKMCHNFDISLKNNLTSRMWFTGEIGRGFYVIDSYKLLKDEGEELSEDEVFDASVVTWCIKWVC